MPQKPMLVMAGNHPLRISGIDQETAFLNRMVTIYFQNPVQEWEMRQELYRDLLDEAPYIIGEAIQAYHRLEQNRFELVRVPVPEEYAPRDARNSYRSISRFLDECCELAEGTEVTTGELFSAYCAFNDAQTPQIGLVDFARNLRELLSKYPEVSALKRVGGQEQRGYRGIRLL